MYTRILECPDIPISSSCGGLLSCLQPLKEVLVTDFSCFNKLFGFGHFGYCFYPYNIKLFSKMFHFFKEESKTQSLKLTLIQKGCCIFFYYVMCHSLYSKLIVQKYHSSCFFRFLTKKLFYTLIT